MKNIVEIEFGKPTVIKVYGWVMLRGVKERRYLVLRNKGVMGDIVWFKSLNGKKTFIGHYYYDVHPWLNGSIENLNRIEIISN
jgi:hypothetical protein